MSKLIIQIFETVKSPFPPILTENTSNILLILYTQILFFLVCRNPTNIVRWFILLSYMNYERLSVTAHSHKMLIFSLVPAPSSILLHIHQYIEFHLVRNLLKCYNSRIFSILSMGRFLLLFLHTRTFACFRTQHSHKHVRWKLISVCAGRFVG